MSEFTVVQEIIEDRPDHHYRTEIPNIVFEMGLDPFQLTVYLHIKKIAGDKGQCWRTVKNLSKLCNMSETKLKQCLTSLSKLTTPLIKIIHRKKPDGSADTNLIHITDIWRVNGDHYRNPQEKIGGSPQNPGVGREKTQGGSPRDYKQEHSEEKPFEEQTNVPVVCSSSDEEKRKLLSKYPLPEKMILSFLSLTIEHLTQSCLAFDQYALKANPENPIGCLNQAIVGQWKPNVTKADKAKKQEQKKVDLSKKVAQNRQIALEMQEKYSVSFKTDYNFSVSDNIVHLKYVNTYHVLNLAEDGCIEVLQYYIETRLLNL